MLRRLASQKGDTLVEVLLATVIMSTVVAGAYTLSNRARLVNQEAFERSQVAKIMQEQLELVRAARDAYSSPTAPESNIWNYLASSYAVNGAVASAQPFHIEPDQFDFGNAPNYGVLNGSTDGDLGVTFYDIYMELRRYGNVGNYYYEVQVFSSWDRLGGGPPARTSAVLRLEDPV